MDPRHKNRIKIIQNLFSYSFLKLKKTLPYPKEKTTKKIILNLNKIDKSIILFANKFTLDKIAKTDLAILRLAIYELMINKKEPQKVIINEAIELAKDMGGEKSFSFVNGVLGGILLNMQKPK